MGQDRISVIAVAALAMVQGACTSPTRPDPVPATAAAPASASAPVSASATATATASASAPAITVAEATDLLYPDGPPGGSKCDLLDPIQKASARIKCLLFMRYDDEAVLDVAAALYESTGSVAGLEREHTMDGGFRGKLHLVPELPVGRYGKHLQWVTEASKDFATFFQKLSGAAKQPVRYRHQPIAWKFFRSVGRTTPSAYAQGWSVAYNVSGSLHSSADAVRETLFHEIFHLNDAAHGHDGQSWSQKALRRIHDAILAQCGQRPACLTPYAPTKTMVRGGTYYAFQPNNGDAVNEYAADLAARYYMEQRAVLRGEKPVMPAFKCGPAENAEAFRLVADEFFGGVDMTPGC